MVVFYSLIVKLACPIEVDLRPIHVFVLYFLFCFLFLPAAPRDTKFYTIKYYIIMSLSQKSACNGYMGQPLHREVTSKIPPKGQIQDSTRSNGAMLSLLRMQLYFVTDVESRIDLRPSADMKSGANLESGNDAESGVDSITPTIVNQVNSCILRQHW